MRGERGVYLEILSEPGFDLALGSLDRRDRSKHARHIELVAVREVEGRSHATVFVPEGKLDTLEKLVVAYQTKGGDEKPRNRNLVESISAIRRGALRSLWTDEPAAFPADGVAIEWEVWLRTGDDGGKALFDEFRAHAVVTGLRVADDRLTFPDRSVCRAHGSLSQMTASVEALNCIAELRKAKELATFFTEQAGADQMAWVASFVGRMVAPPSGAPAVCVLDSGVTSEHPLLHPAIDAASLHSFDPAWGVGDARRWSGHGTSMASLALHGDLVVALGETMPRVAEHRLESVKILPPEGFPHNQERLYGTITAQAAALAEIGAPQRSRVFCLAVTANDARDRGEASSWSATVDDLAFGLDGGEPRLFVISAGNIDDPAAWREYPTSNDLETIRDPAQAWNALTVGAMTEKLTFDSRKYPGWRPIASRGGLSHSSRTSIRCVAPCPRKPDLVMEGGNAAMNPTTGEVDALDELALLSAHWRPTEKVLAPCGDTSAATAQVARLAAILQARYPTLWPETIRALLVHSAEWTPHMRLGLGATPRRQAYRDVLRRYGWGVPDLDRACWSASNALTLVIQDSLQPYGPPKGSSVPTKDMHMHQLPWPREQLEELLATQVKLRVTLSYFVQSNPARRGWKYRHLYGSHGLRFEMPRAGEPTSDFAARVNKQAQAEHEDDPVFTGSPWAHRDREGSIHSDWWEGTAADLASRGRIAVFPVIGWWKERPHLKRWTESVRYALIVSIKSPATEVDIFTPVAQMVATKSAVEIPVG